MGLNHQMHQHMKKMQFIQYTMGSAPNYKNAASPASLGSGTAVSLAARMHAVIHKNTDLFLGNREHRNMIMN